MNSTWQAAAPLSGDVAALMRKLGFFCLARLLSLACMVPVARADEVAVPELSARVTDLTPTLDSNTVKSLTATLAGLEKDKGAQIAVLMVPTTGQDTIEQYARRVFAQWKIGRAACRERVCPYV